MKKYRVVRASLEGVHAVSSGMVIAATFLIYAPMEGTNLNYFLMIGTALTLFFTKIPTPFIILGGLVLGIVIT
ncbi:MAG: chromate transporter, partial [Cyclobacteriaceae bacterium]